MRNFTLAVAHIRSRASWPIILKAVEKLSLSAKKKSTEKCLALDHALRLIDQHVDFSFIRPKLPLQSHGPIGSSRDDDADIFIGLSVWDQL